MARTRLRSVHQFTLRMEQLEDRISPSDMLRALLTGVPVEAPVADSAPESIDSLPNAPSDVAVPGPADLAEPNSISVESPATVETSETSASRRTDPRDDTPSSGSGSALIIPEASPTTPTQATPPPPCPVRPTPSPRRAQRARARSLLRQAR